MDFFNKNIKNKRVAILGPADYVNKELDDNHGEFINKFDTVIRLNSMLKFPKKELEKYYGTKFDVLVSGFWPFNDHPQFIEGPLNKSRYLYIDNYKDISHNLLLFDYSTESYYKEYIYNKNKTFFDKNKHISFFSFPFNFLEMLRQKFNIVRSPTTGLVAILLCLLLNAKEIYVSGVTFYSDKKHNGYYDSYSMMNEKLYKSKQKNKKYMFDGKQYRNLPTGHDFYDEARIFKKLYKKYNIHVDKYLKTLIE